MRPFSENAVNQALEDEISEQERTKRFWERPNKNGRSRLKNKANRISYEEYTLKPLEGLKKARRLEGGFGRSQGRTAERKQIAILDSFAPKTEKSGRRMGLRDLIGWSDVPYKTTRKFGEEEFWLTGVTLSLEEIAKQRRANPGKRRDRRRAFVPNGNFEPGLMQFKRMSARRQQEYVADEQAKILRKIGYNARVVRWKDRMGVFVQRPEPAREWRATVGDKWASSERGRLVNPKSVRNIASSPRTQARHIQTLTGQALPLDLYQRDQENVLPFGYGTNENNMPVYDKRVDASGKG